MRRKPNVEERRRNLCDAAIELLAEDGARGLTHLRVDRRAGTSHRAGEPGDGTVHRVLVVDGRQWIRLRCERPSPPNQGACRRFNTPDSRVGNPEAIKGVNMIGTAVAANSLVRAEPGASAPEQPQRSTPTETPERLTPAETPERITPAEPPERLTPSEPPERQTAG